MEVELGTQKYRPRADVTTEPERTDLYNKTAVRYPAFAEYERDTERVILVISLMRLT